MNLLALLYFPVNFLGANLDPGIGSSCTAVGEWLVILAGVLVNEGELVADDVLTSAFGCKMLSFAGILLADEGGCNGLVDEVKLLSVEIDDVEV